jgi:hypothetical protein
LRDGPVVGLTQAGYAIAGFAFFVAYIMVEIFGTKLQGYMVQRFNKTQPLSNAAFIAPLAIKLVCWVAAQPQGLIVRQKLMFQRLCFGRSEIEYIENVLTPYWIKQTYANKFRKSDILEVDIENHRTKVKEPGSDMAVHVRLTDGPIVSSKMRFMCSSGMIRDYVLSRMSSIL